MSDINPYEPPKTMETAVGGRTNAWPWIWAACSVAASSLSLMLFYLYGHWHWHAGPWEQTLPGQFGLSWITAVDRSKELSMLLAGVSLVITIVLFGKGCRLQAMLTLPTCMLSVLTVPIVT